jgi:hypothetical protein
MASEEEYVGMDEMFLIGVDDSRRKLGAIERGSAIESGNSRSFADTVGDGRLRSWRLWSIRRVCEGDGETRNGIG